MTSRGRWQRSLCLLRIIGVLAAAALPVTVRADCAEQTLHAGDGGPDGRFGVAAEVSGPFAAIGGRSAINGARAGAVYVFERSGGSVWSEVDVLLAPPGADAGGFGTVLAIGDDVLAVGEPSADDACAADPECNSGAVHVYVRDAGGPEWSGVQRLVADDATAGDAFGGAVAVHGDLLVVGAAGTSDGGAAYVFERVARDTWIERVRLTAPGRAPGSRLGSLVAATDTVIAASAPATAATPPDNVRRVHVFERSGTKRHDWQHLDALESDGLSAADGFAISLAATPTAIVVGAPGDDTIAINSGAAYVFRRTGGAWPLLAKITVPDAAAQDGYGASVAADRHWCAVSSFPLLTGGVTNTYAIGGGDAVHWIGTAAPANGAASDLIGWRTALDDNALFVAAIGDDDLGANAGAVYAFELDRCVACPADLDHGGDVGTGDLLLMLSTWGRCAEAVCFADLNGDDVTDFADLVLLLSAWGACD